MICDLPDEVIVKILSQLSIQERIHLSEVSHRVFELCHEPLLYKRFLPHRDIAKHMTEEQFQALVRRGIFDSTTELDISRCTQITGEGLIHLSERCDLNRIKTLKLAGNHIHARFVERILQSSQLEELSILNGRMNSIRWSSCNIQSLTHLNLSSCKIGKECIQELRNSGLIYRLKSLQMYNNRNVKDEELLTLFESTPEQPARFQLELLNIKSLMMISDVGFSQAIHACCETLLELTISNCKITNVGFIAIATCTNLLKLDAKGLNQITDETFYLTIRQLPQLRGINLLGCRQLTDASAISLCNFCDHLEYVVLGNLTITDECLPHLNSLPKLSTLDLTGCSQITDEGVLALCAGWPDPCTRIQRLDFQKCYHLSDEAISACLDKCVELQKFDLQNCTGLTNRTLTRLLGFLQFQYETLGQVLLLNINMLSCNGISTEDPHHEQILESLLVFCTKHRVKFSFSVEEQAE
jgi:Leucine-rich repeat (LRR) protein